MSGVNLLDVNKYFSYFSIKKKEDIVDSEYVWSVPTEDETRFGKVGGDLDLVDTPLEFALLSYYSQPVVNIRPIDAKNMLPANNPRVAGLKLGSAVLKELAEIKFFDPNNRDAVGRYEGMLKFISDKNGVTRVEIEGYLKQGIAAEVDKHFNAKYGNFIPAVVYGELKGRGEPDALALVTNAVAGFFIDPNRTTYATLTGIEARYWLNGSLDRQTFNFAADNAFYGLLNALSPVLAKRVSDDVSRNAAALARVPNDPQYNIFSNPPGIR
jgi:hypothetical protein